MANRVETKRALGGGVAAGVIAGLVLALFMVLMTVAGGGDPWLVFKGASAPFLGERATAPGFDFAAVMMGGLIHLAISAFWGALFGLLFYGFSQGATLGFGILWGFVVWIGMYYVALPLAGLGAVARETPIVMAILNHVVFGLSTALAFLPFQRESTARWPRYRREVLP